MRLLKVLAMILLVIEVLGAQQPQTQVGVSSVNAKYVNGVAPGYWPTKGSGMTLNLSAGTAYCSTTIATYAGGTLTMTGATNYVYLDTTASCAPGTNTSGFLDTTIPIAMVVTSGGAITTISDSRTMFSTATGGPSGISNITGPTDLLNHSIGGGTDTITEIDQQPNYVYMGPPYAGGSILFSQVLFPMPHNDTYGATTVSGTISNASGNILITPVMLARAGTGMPTSLDTSDTNGNSWTQGSYTTGIGNAFQLNYALNVNSGSNTLTATIAGPGSNQYDFAMPVLEYSGVAAASPLDQLTATYGSAGSPPDSACVTTSVANDILIGGFTELNLNIGTISDPSWTIRYDLRYTAAGFLGQYLIAEKIAPTTGIYCFSVQGGSGSSGDTVFLAAFKPSGGAVNGKPAFRPLLSSALPPGSVPLDGVTAAIGGSPLLAGACASGTLSVPGVTTLMVPNVSPQTYPGDGFWWEGYVSGADTVTVKVCAAVTGTPVSAAYNVRVTQ